MKKNITYKICTRCVMDTSDEDIIFDSEGVCNHCKEYEIKYKQTRYDIHKSEILVNELVNKINQTGIKNKYNCIIGISGGVDSCYVVHLAYSWGLKPLLIHMDNGWNSEIAVQNVKKMIDKLNLDYVSYVLDWKEFRDIQLGFLKSSIVDIEMPTDFAIPASIFKVAKKNNIKIILSGGNYTSEGILPLTWGYHVKKDMKLYNHIVKKFSKVKRKNVPAFGLIRNFYYKILRGIKTYYPLNYVDYNKDLARSFLIKEYDWQDYGGKHHESKITKFWQSYVMPLKYNMDYRRATISSQIVSGQINRKDALEKLKSKPFNEENILADKMYIAKKFSISLDELNRYLDQEPKTYKDFPNQRKLLEWFYNLYFKINLKHNKE